MVYEWDESKNQINYKKHNVTFQEAARIFRGPVITARDLRKDYGESRFISIGAVSGVVILVVAHTDRMGVTRIISARRANEDERRTYYEYIKEEN